MAQHIEPLYLANIINLLSGQATCESDWSIWDISTDSRSISTPNCLYVALRGTSFDGHDFVAQAFQKGAAAAVVSQRVEGVDGMQIVVPDTLSALGTLAKYYRSLFNIPVIGVTGSVGKTSTKEMIAAAVRPFLNVQVNKASYNNEVGVPLTLFGIDRNTQAAVLEMGMRGIGQIEYLCNIATPNIGVITNIGMSHIELLKSRENIAIAKSELLTSLGTSGVAVINADNDFAEFLKERSPSTVITFGASPSADFRITELRYIDNKDTLFKVNDIDMHLNATGDHHAMNAAAACAVASILGYSVSEIAGNLRSFRSVEQRGSMSRTKDDIIVIDDTYNAAPDSYRSALQTLSIGGANRRKVAILGEMREMGENSSEAHAYVGRIVSERNIDALVTVGRDARYIAEAASSLQETQKQHFESADETALKVADLVRPGDVVLVKGSRAMQMEKIVARLERGLADLA
jgi:UDP-N-acetylmuramoyl-tripeptide--D-alanyl-D-alanine ligase